MLVSITFIHFKLIKNYAVKQFVSENVFVCDLFCNMLNEEKK